MDLKEARYQWLIIYDFLHLEDKNSQDYSMMLEVSNDILEAEREQVRCRVALEGFCLLIWLPATRGHSVCVNLVSWTLIDDMCDFLYVC